jgi:hypothetical protein
MTPGSTIEFLVWLLIAASIIAVIAARLRNSLHRRTRSLLLRQEARFV